MYVLIVLVYQMVITWKIIAALVMLTAPMTVFRIVLEHGVAIQQLMNVVFVMVIIARVPMNAAYQMAIIPPVLMNVAYQMVITHPVLTVLVYPMVIM